MQTNTPKAWRKRTWAEQGRLSSGPWRAAAPQRGAIYLEPSLSAKPRLSINTLLRKHPKRVSTRATAPLPSLRTPRPPGCGSGAAPRNRLHDRRKERRWRSSRTRRSRAWRACVYLPKVPGRAGVQDPVPQAWPPLCLRKHTGSLPGVLAWPLDVTSVLASRGAREREPGLSGSFGFTDVGAACWEAVWRSVGVIPPGPWAGVGTAAHGPSEENAAFKGEVLDRVLLSPVSVHCLERLRKISKKDY